MKLKDIEINEQCVYFYAWLSSSWTLLSFSFVAARPLLCYVCKPIYTADSSKLVRTN